MSLFGVQRLLEGWPSLRGGNVLLNLFVQYESVRGVWLYPGHVFVATDSHSVYIFNQVPLRETLPHEGYSQINVTSKVIEILYISPAAVLVIESNGSVQVLQYDSSLYQWNVLCSALLYTGDGDLVAAATTTRNNQLIYSVHEEEAETDSSDEWNYSVYTLSYNIDNINEMLDLSEYSQLLCHCPSMCLYPVQSGVWLVPDTGVLAPPNLMLCWDGTSDSVQPFVWREGSSCEFIRDANLKDFKIISRRSASVWSKESPGSSLVSFAVHPVMKKLTCLTDSGTVYQISEEDGSSTLFAQLNDFAQRYPSPKLWYSSSSPAVLQLFVLHTYLGVCRQGELRLYDSATGEFIWECDDLDHPTTRLFVPRNQRELIPVSLWNKSGIHLLRCKKITDHARMFVDSLFPIATNADETTPGDPLDNAEIIAARLCHLWSLDMLASQYTLKLAHTMLKQSPISSILPSELLQLLSELAVQNPLICVALLSQYPMYRHLLGKLVSQFLDKFHQSDKIPSLLDTQTVPLLKRYLELSQQYEELLTTPTQLVDHTPSVRERVVEILATSQQSTLSHDHIVQLRAELSNFSFTDPSDTLLGIKDFMNVSTSFADALKKMQSSSTNCEFNWRSILSSEVPEKLPERTPKPTSQMGRLPVFEMTVQLLYCHEPQDLVHFVAFVHEVRDVQHSSDSTYTRQCRKGHFYQRALDVIPSPTKMASAEQIHSYCQILLLSGAASAELKALTLLLDMNMWSDVIDMLNQVHHQVPTPVQCVLFHSTLLRMAKEGVLHQYISSVWPLLPETYSIHNFLDILKLSESSCDTSGQVYLEETSNDLRVEKVIPYILELLSHQELQ